MELTHYHFLIRKQLTGELTPEERAELERWLQADDANRQVLETYTRLWQISAVLLPADRRQYQRTRLLDRINRDVQQTNLTRIRLHRIAAGIVFFAASITLALYSVNSPVTLTARVRQNVWLADSGHIILQPKAVLTFYHSSRELAATFEGEGLFELVRHAVITLPNATVHTVTSSFFIKHKPDGHVLIEVLSGQVTVTTGKGDVVLKANEQCIVDETGPHVSRLHAQGSIQIHTVCRGHYPCTMASLGTESIEINTTGHANTTRISQFLCAINW